MYCLSENEYAAALFVTIKVYAFNYKLVEEY